MKTLLSLLLFCGLSHAATVATAIVPYRSIEDSPWKVAVNAGDALTFLNHKAENCDDTLLPPTLPDGLGVYDDFGDCRTPWAVPFGAENVSNRSVDADDGKIDGSLLGHSISRLTNTPSFTIQFFLTSDNKYPRWLGFASMNYFDTAPTMDVFGEGGGLLETINLSALNNAVGTSPYAKFQGFLFDIPISSIRFNGAIIIDHFQYGYGAAPIPEPAGMGLLGVAAALGLNRRRRGPGYAVKQPSSLQRQG